MLQLAARVCNIRVAQNSGKDMLGPDTVGVEVVVEIEH